MRAEAASRPVTVRNVIIVSLAALTAASGIAAVFGEFRDNTVSGFMMVGLFVVILLGYEGLGGLIVVRRDGHPVGWLLMSLGLLLVFSVGSESFSFLGWFGEWIGVWCWHAAFGINAVLTIVFPSGMIPSGDGLWFRIGRWSLWTLPVFVVVAALSSCGEGCGVPAFVILPEALWILSMLGVMATLIGGVVSLVVRLRRSHGEERAQFAWVMFGIAILTTLTALNILLVMTGVVSGENDIDWLGVALGQFLLPVVFAIAVLRYRLYDIGRLVRRSAAFVIVSIVLAAGYATLILGLNPLLEPLIGEGDLPVALATLAMVVLFTPLRRKVQSVVDHRFDRSGYDARLEVERLGATLLTAVESNAVTRELAAVVHRTLRPDEVAVWIRAEAKS